MDWRLPYTRSGDIPSERWTNEITKFLKWKNLQESWIVWNGRKSERPIVVGINRLKKTMDRLFCHMSRIKWLLFVLKKSLTNPGLQIGLSKVNSILYSICIAIWIILYRQPIYFSFSTGHPFEFSWFSFFLTEKSYQQNITRIDVDIFNEATPISRCFRTLDISVFF